MYDQKQLKQYKSKHGDCKVPNEYKDNPQLGNWVKNIKANEYDLSKKQKDELNKLGFNWGKKRGKNISWEDRFVSDDSALSLFDSGSVVLSI